MAMDGNDNNGDGDGGDDNVNNSSGIGDTTTAATMTMIAAMTTAVAAAVAAAEAEAEAAAVAATVANHRTARGRSNALVNNRTWRCCGRVPVSDSTYVGYHNILRQVPIRSMDFTME